MSDFRPPHRLVFHPTVFYVGTDGRRGKRKRLMLSNSFSFSLSTGKHRVLPPSPATSDNKSLLLICIVYLSPLVCWINHFTPVINKRTDGWMSLPSNYWFTNRQDVYFLRENYTEHFNCWFFFLFVLFFWFLPLSTLPGFLARRGRLLWDCTDPPPDATPQTGAIKHWSLEKHTHTCSHLQHLCYYTSGDLSFLHTINPQQDMTKSTKIADVYSSGSLCNILEFYLRCETSIESVTFHYHNT